MTRTALIEQTTAILVGAHRVVRVLDPSEGPFAGALVTDGEQLAVCVSTAGLSDWEGWRFSGSEHVVGPTDLVRRGDGHDVLLPWCTERVAGFLARRIASGERLTPGECVTLLVSLLRALGDLSVSPGVVTAAEGDEETRGTWWLTDGGRPVLVTGEGDGARQGVLTLIGQLEEHNAERTLGRLLASVRAGVGKSVEQQPGMPRLLLDRWEAEALEIASPRALRRESVLSPSVHAVRPGRGARGTPASDVGVSETSSTRAALRRGRRSDGLGEERLRAGPVRSSGYRRAGASLRGRWDALVSGVADRSPRRRTVERTRTGGSKARGSKARGAKAGEPRSMNRRRSVAIAAAVAGVVLVAGLLWPSGDGGDASVGSQDESSSESTAAGPSEGGAAPETGDESPPGDRLAEGASAPPAAAETNSEDSDPVTAADALWSDVLGCVEAGDDACTDAVEPGSSRVLGAIASTAVERPTFSLIDEYGDIAVVRGELGGAGVEKVSDDTSAPAARVLVLSRLNDKWLIRDVYDVADQPG